jgi:hypothetical protein
MDADVVSNSRPQAFASRTAAERVKAGAGLTGAFRISWLPVAERPPQPKVAQGRLRRRRSSPMRRGIAFVAAPCIRPRGARNATLTLFQQPVKGGRRLASFTLLRFTFHGLERVLVRY